MDIDPGPVDRARRRLASALDALEASMTRRAGAERSAAALEAELRDLAEDRSRLAQELDHAHARSSRLETVAGEVSGRLDSAISSIRGLLGYDRSV